MSAHLIHIADSSDPLTSSWMIHSAIANQRWSDLDILLGSDHASGGHQDANISVLLEAFDALAKHGQWTRLKRLFSRMPHDSHERCLSTAWDCAISLDDPSVFQHFNFNIPSLRTVDLACSDAKFMFLAAQTHIPETLAGTLSQKATAGWLLRLASHISTSQARGMLDYLEKHHPEDTPTMRHMAWQQAIEKKDVRAIQNFLLAGISPRNPDQFWFLLFSKPDIGMAVCQNEEVKALLQEHVAQIQAVQPNAPFDGLWSLAPFQAMERAGLPVLDVRDKQGQSIIHAMLEYQSDPIPTLAWVLLVRPEILLEADQRGKRPIDHLSSRELTARIESCLQTSFALGCAEKMDKHTPVAPNKERKARL